MADSSDIVRRVTIQASGEGIDSTTNSVKALGGAVEDTNNKANSSLWAEMAAGIVGVGVAAVGAYAGLKAFIDVVGEQSKALSDLSDHADIAAMSAKEFQETMYAAMSKGVSSNDFSTGMDKIAADLVAASQGTTEFTKLLAANGLAIDKNASASNQMKQALSDIMTLMQNASPAVQQKLAQIVGVSQSWIPFLKEGTNEFEAQKKAANDLGIVIDDSTIAKAKEFTDQWHTAVAGWDLQFKASMASILPTLTQLATLASKIIDGVGGVSGDIGRWLTPIDQQGSKQLNDTINDVYRLREMIEGNGSPFAGNGTSNSTFAGLKANNLANMLGLPEGATIEQVDAMLDKLSATYDKANNRLRVTPNDDYTTKLPATDEGGDAFTRASDQMEKRIAILKSESEAAGENAQFTAQLRAEYELYAAAERGSLVVDDAKEAAIRKLSIAFGDATAEAKKAKTEADISFNTQTAFLSPDDVKIATQLRGQFDSVGDSLNSAQAAAIRMNNTLKTINDTIRTGAAAFANDFVKDLEKGETVLQSLKDAAANLGSTLQTAGINSLVNQGLNALTGPGVGAAALTAGATSAAAAITAACTAGGAALAAGGVSAGAALGTGGAVAGTTTAAGGVTAGTAVGAGGTVAGATTAAGGAAAGTALAAGGAAAGAALWGPIAALGVAAAGVGLSLFGSGDSAQQKQEAAQQAAAKQQQQEYEDGLARQQQFNDQTALSGVDTSTVSGQIQAFDIQANAQRAAEMKAGGEAIVELEKSLAAQRQAIVDKANQQVIKSYQDFLNSIKTGDLSTLSPEDQLKYAQNLFNKDVAGAKTGDQASIDAVTQDAQNLLTLAKSYYASSSGYGDVYKGVTDAITGLENGGALYTAPKDTGINNSADTNPNTYATYSQLVKDNGGYASGGLITNGVRGVDSLLAHVAGGEFVTQTSSVNASTLGALQYINSTGRAPQGASGDALNNVARILTQGFNGQTGAIVDALQTLINQIQNLTNTTRQAATQRRVPGSDKRAA